jgi:two-component system, chemotaxis family, chemotaxis protein CheY
MAHRGNILVVDDGSMMRRLLQMHLESAGYLVRVAEDALVGGQEVLRSPPDLLICDVRMPHMSGIEFVTALCADTTIPPFPVVFLTSEERSAAEGMAAGAKAFLTKPVLKEKLLETVEKLLSARDL